MKTSTNGSSLTSTLLPRLAQFGAAHGYRFAGDIVHLNAMFSVLDPAAHARSWRLQLRACPTAPSHSSVLAGHLVAEISLPPMGEVADDTENFEVTAHALLPAGQAEHVMVLALVSSNERQVDEVHDWAAYPQRERFPHPSLRGTVSFRHQGDRVVLEVENMENLRTPSNLSGTLSLELWALTEAYQGGAFHGTPLAGVTFAGLAGQQSTGPRTFDLPYTPPAAGHWTIVLMLREWNGQGYVTRDFTNFPHPLIIEAPAPAPSAKPTEEKHAPAAPTAVAAPAPSAPAPAKGVSINQATREELAAVKGLPVKVAEAIVAQRPFRALDELTRVKGMGVKLLAKLRAKLRL